MKHLFITLSLCLIAFLLNAQNQYVIQSENLVKPDTIWVFTPKDYDANQTFPVVYLLHGWSGNYHHWNDMIDCQKYANNYNTIIVCPDGLYDSWYLNSPVQNENKYLDFFSEELIPLVSENYHINEDSIFITGLSMGGHGALYLFEKNSKYFQSAGSLSGLLDLTNWSDYYGIDRVLGLSKSKNNYEILWNYSVMGNIDNHKSTNKKIIVSCGTEDAFLNNNNQFVDFCIENNIDVTFLKAKGNHNATYWRSAVINHFEFFFNTN